MTAKSRRPGLRRVRVVAPRRHLLVFTEGELTEEQYLNHWRRRHRDTVLVTIDPYHGPPAQLVDRAVAAARADRRSASRGEGRAYDEVWCVFDVDQHPGLDAAMEKAAANSIDVALSNPCIELWFLLHFADQTAHLERGEAQRLASGHLACDKALSSQALAALTDRYPDAKQRAIDLVRKHDGDGSPPHANPSSSMWQLIDRLRDAS